jgi:CheY-like chemotaxis protein
MARILLVEDDPAFAYALARSLRAEGHEVVACGESIKALEELESQRPVDILVTDLRLPEGVPHGFSLGRMAKLRRPHLPIIFMTGYPDIAANDKTPPGPVLYKPIEPQALGAAVADELAQAGRRRRPLS